MSSTDLMHSASEQITPFPRFVVASGAELSVGRTGPVDALSIEEVLEGLRSLTAWSELSPAEVRARVGGARCLLEWLQHQPGDGWQAKWMRCEPEPGPLRWVESAAISRGRVPKSFRADVVKGLAGLLLHRVFLPSYDFLVGYYAVRLFTETRAQISAELFDRAEAAATERGMVGRQVAEVLTVLAKIVLHTGKELDQVTIEDLMAHRSWNINRYGRHKSGIHGAWDVLRDIGVITTDQSLRAALRSGQPTTEELVAQRRVQCEQVRDVLIRYLNERRPAMDFSSFRQLTCTLVETFWRDIERHHPGIDTLDLPHEVADAWKERIAFTTGKGKEGQRRVGRLEVLSRIRSFYLDIQEWAHEDPSWAPWAVRCPIRRSELGGMAKQVRATTAKVHQRIRERLPHLPALVESTERHRQDQAELLEAARNAQIEEIFEHNGTAYRRMQRASDKRGTNQHGPEAVMVENTNGEAVDILRQEEDAFWTWAIIETLRHTGVRIEELLELTHLALISYRLPETGEIIPLLQIVPSKSNEERLLLVPPELASVLAAVICRIREPNGRVPLAARYDPHERLTGPPLPHLFQRKIGWRREILSPKAIYRLLGKALEHAGLTDRTGQPLHYTPHDFRRMFITDAVTGGLPVHIAAKILGHHDLSTTQAYLAVFQDDLIKNYRAFLDSRRTLRPTAEYREPTEEEWAEFQKHFELRKVELGTCGRPYGTPCAHEHACVRCPMLRVDLTQRRRLEEIIRNLSDRIDEARAYGWGGEVQGLQVSLEAARNKLASLNRLARSNNQAAVNLGMPVIPGRSQ